MERENQQTFDINWAEAADGLHNGPLVLATRSHAMRKEHPSLFICAHTRIFLARPRAAGRESGEEKLDTLDLILGDHQQKEPEPRPLMFEMDQF